MYYLSSTLDTGGTAIKYKDNKMPCFMELTFYFEDQITNPKMYSYYRENMIY